MAPIQSTADQALQDFYDLTPSRRLGRGRHAIVVECRSRNDRVYAMKLFKEDSRDRIAREIEILRYFRSGPNIIQIVDIVQGEEVCLSMSCR
jgi:casein kinase II subunit alpha